MNIAINSMPSSAYGGITYLKYLLPVLDQREDGHNWYVYGPSANLDKVRFTARKIFFREVNPRGGLLGRLLSEHLGLPVQFRRDRIDVVYTANNPDLFFARRPRVNAIRYTEPFVYKEFYNSFPKRVRCEALRVLTTLSLRTADHVICVSDYARRIVAEAYPGTDRKCTVIHHGLQRDFASDANRPAWAPDKFLFAAAKMVGYSNLDNLVEAYRLCRLAGIEDPLLIAGGPHDIRYEQTVKSRIETSGLAPYVIFTGYLDQPTLAYLYSQASVFIFSSLLEACPNTLIEALGCSAAIVASSAEPNIEIAGSAAAWCDGRNPSDMARAIVCVANDRDLNQRLRSAALRQSQLYSWQRTADALIETLRAVVGSSTQPFKVTT